MAYVEKEEHYGYFVIDISKNRHYHKYRHYSIPDELAERLTCAREILRGVETAINKFLMENPSEVKDGN